MKTAINAYKVDYDLMDPSDFIKLTDKEKASIERVSIVPPVLGGGNFGSIKVEYKTSYFKASNNK